MNNLAFAFIITMIFIIIHAVGMGINEEFVMGHAGMFSTVFVSAFVGAKICL